MVLVAAVINTSRYVPRLYIAALWDSVLSLLYTSSFKPEVQAITLKLNLNIYHTSKLETRHSTFLNYLQAVDPANSLPVGVSMDHNTGAQTPQESFSNPEPDFRQEPELQTQAPAQENFSWMENEDFDRLMNGDFGDLNFSEFLVPIEDSYTILKPEQRGEVPATSNNTTAEANVPSSSVSFEGLQALLDRVPEDLVAQLNEEFQSIADGRGIFTQGSEDQTLRDQDGSYIDPAQLAQRGEAGSFNTTHHQPSHANSVAADEGFTGLTTSPNPSSLEQGK